MRDEEIADGPAGPFRPGMILIVGPQTGRSTVYDILGFIKTRSGGGGDQQCRRARRPCLHGLNAGGLEHVVALDPPLARREATRNQRRSRARQQELRQEFHRAASPGPRLPADGPNRNLPGSPSLRAVAPSESAAARNSCAVTRNSTLPSANKASARPDSREISALTWRMDAEISRTAAEDSSPSLS